MYPSIFTTFTDPLASNTLNAPSHSSIETAQNTALEQLERVVGTTSSAVGSLTYNVRATASDGGGHIQSSNKGGTGQTTYIKGDILVATSASVLTKLAVGADNQILTSDSSVAGGIKWGLSNQGNKIVNTSSLLTLANSESSIFSVTIPGSTLGSSNALRATAYIDSWLPGNGAEITFKAFYGGNLVASVVTVTGANIVASIGGTVQFALIANATTSAQRGIIDLNLGKNTNAAAVTSVLSVRLHSIGTTSVLSDANQTLGMTAQAASGTSFRVNGCIVEKIS